MMIQVKNFLLLGNFLFYLSNADDDDDGNNM